ncbi:hypothetical protein MYCTH_2312816 [Thermothelomyces thermophilus ATCC 42464]|uniref:Uncharacterized protein n=1 Tax=Thermothelomyces thermophilus (strain ATCC 42464 / BCRC 31852 / DSM 1799) TaxID=573729 RepID=G2QN99_THET4|nr:uncharacterized protein MYCTH_2312816 [Thermothelomyces thermophilus ATCC 42464]AEO61972.1 hypothetical protein MYCTH_2312816 [Thermothelomyces thermophilus ATCC 42464]
MQAKKRGRERPPRASNPDAAESSRQVAEPSSSDRPARPAATNKLPNRRTSAEATGPAGEPSRQQQEDPLDMLAKHRRLTALTRHIPRATIASKWTTLSAPSIAAVSSLLADSARPVLHRLRDRDQRHAQAALILRTFAARLHSKLVKGMPFPPPTVPAPRGRRPTKGGSGGGGGEGATGGNSGGGGGGHEVELDFEKTVDAIAGLERALDPLLHSLVLLRREKEREERALERDYAALRRLEANARAQARGWKEGRGRGREHVLVGGLVGAEGDRNGESGSLELVPPSAKHGAGGAGGVFKDLQEEELLALSQQIGSHMESMKNNLSQIEGVLPAIARSRAALQGVLCEHLDPEQYEQVLLG